MDSGCNVSVIFLLFLPNPTRGLAGNRAVLELRRVAPASIAFLRQVLSLFFFLLFPPHPGDSRVQHPGVTEDEKQSIPPSLNL